MEKHQVDGRYGLFMRWIQRVPDLRQALEKAEQEGEAAEAVRSKEAQARKEASLAETRDYINRTFNNPRAPGDGRSMCG